MPVTIEAISAKFHNSIYHRDVVDNKLICNWIDEAQVEIAKYYGNMQTHAYNDAERNERYDLPDNALAVVRVRRNGDDKPYLDYLISDFGQITFLENGDFTIEYFRVPTPVERDNPSAEAEMHVLFAPAIVVYCVYKYWIKEAEGIPSEVRYANGYLNEFHRMVGSTADSLLRRARGPRRIR